MDIIIDRLTKAFGRKKALNSICLEIGEGMFGLLGPNGAGKTTLMRILATLLKKTEGTVTVNGQAIENRKYIREIVGYLPQDFSLYPGLTVYETMDYLALLSKIGNSSVRRTRIDELLEKVNLQEERKTKVKALSGGMKRRLGIAQALMNNPRLLIVDEPTAGLDPEERIRFRNLLARFSQGRTVLLSTHIVSDIEHSCENMAVLKLGDLVYNGKVNGLLQQTQGNVWQAEVDGSEWGQLRDRLDIRESDILSAVAEGNRLKLRLLSPERPFGEATTAEPTIEDSYMNLLREAR